MLNGFLFFKLISLHPLFLLKNVFIKILVALSYNLIFYFEMKTNFFKLTILLGIFGLTTISCKNNTPKTETSEPSQAKDSISVIALDHSKSFDQAILKVSSLEAKKWTSDSIKLNVSYQIENFELTEQTQHNHSMANSHDGQHIHFILNNQPYVALYKPEHSVVLPINSEHYLLSFLSRSYHESIKTDQAFELIHFKINAEGNLEILPKSDAPGLFYSRPKGDYLGVDTKELLLDFFITNISLDSDNYRIKAMINDIEFTLDQWNPYKIVGLPMGKNTIQLSLIDKNGAIISGDNTSVKRTFFLKEE